MVVIVDWAKRCVKSLKYNFKILSKFHVNYKIVQYELFFFVFTIKPYEPKDSIDAACRAHDKCWDEIRNAKKCAYGVWEHYIWELTEGEV